MMFGLPLLRMLFHRSFDNDRLIFPFIDMFGCNDINSPESSGVFNGKGKVNVERRAAEDYLQFTGTGRTGITPVDGDVKVEVTFDSTF
jgi:hypothetical protein